MSDEAIYIVAMRVKGKPRPGALNKVLAALDLARPEDDAEVHVYVRGMERNEAYSLPSKPAAMHNLNDALRAIGFTFDEANRVVPVVTEGVRRSDGS